MHHKAMRCDSQHFCTTNVGHGSEEMKTLESCEGTIGGVSQFEVPEACISYSQKQKGAWDVAVHNLSASWSYEREKTELENISFEVNQVCGRSLVTLLVQGIVDNSFLQNSPLLAVIGPVGAGKV